MAIGTRKHRSRSLRAGIYLLGVWFGPQAHAQDVTPHARALVYAQNPVQSPAATLQLLPLAPRGVGLEHPWLIAQSCVDRAQVVSLSTATGVHRVHFCTPLSSARASADGDYLAVPAADEKAYAAADPFAEQMLFYHVGRALSFFGALGITPPWSASQPLRLVANVRLPRELDPADSKSARRALEPWNDALFVAASRKDAVLFRSLNPEGSDALYFGHGSESRFAYDGDVIAHELTHALLYRLLSNEPWFVDSQGADTAPAAIVEGIADYFAAAMSGGPRIGEHAGRSAAQWQSRTIDTFVACPAGLTGRAHEDGLLISSALWAARKQLSETLDRALVAALRERSEPLSFETLLTGTLAALANDSQHDAEVASAVFHARGLLPHCQRQLTVTPAQTTWGQTGSFFAPAAHAGGLLAPGVMQFRVAVPDDARALRLRVRSSGVQPAPFEAVPTPGWTPVLLTKSEPIVWTAAATHDAEVTHPSEPSPAQPRFTVQTRGARQLYLQVANAGAQAGWYDALAVSFEREPARPKVGPSPATSAPAASAPAGGLARAGRWAGAFALVVVLVWLIWRFRARRN